MSNPIRPPTTPPPVPPPLPPGARPGGNVRVSVQAGQAIGDIQRLNALLQQTHQLAASIQIPGASIAAAGPGAHTTSTAPGAAKPQPAAGPPRVGFAPPSPPPAASPVGSNTTSTASGAAPQGPGSPAAQGLAPSAAAQQPARPVFATLPYRAATSGAEVGLQTIQTITQYNRDPGAYLRAAFGLGQGALRGAERGFQSVFEHQGAVVEQLGSFFKDLPLVNDLVGKFGGPLLRGLLRFGGGAAKVGGFALQYLGPEVLRAARERYGVIGDLAELERPAEMLRALGGPAGMADPQSPFHMLGARYGLRPAQTLSALLPGYRAAGGARTLGPEAFLQAELSGLSASNVGAFFGLGAKGAGGIGAPGALGLLLGFANQEGLRGAKIEQLLSMIEGHTNAAAQRGGEVDLTDVARTAFALRATSGEFVGTQGVRGALALSSLGGGALENLTGLFGQIGPNALLAAAASGGGGVFEIAKRLSEFQRNPSLVPDALTRILGPEAAGFALLGAGFSPQQAEALGGGLRAGVPVAGGFGASEKRLDYAPMLADQERELMGIVSADREVNRELIKQVTETRKFMAELGRVGAEMIVELRELTRTIVELIQGQ